MTPARLSLAQPVPDEATPYHTEPATVRLRGQHLRLGYGDRVICPQLDVRIPDGSFTVIVGPNGCGKSTLLRSLCRLITPQAGQVYLDGKQIRDYPARTVAQQLGLLPQSATAPDGISVLDLVSRGRYPHQSLLRQWSPQDEIAVQTAMQATGVADLAGRAVDELSGGQRQRVWVAMALAQETPLLLLDEPTTYLDIAHQIELLELFRHLNRHNGRTLIAVLHDLNHACRYATHLIAMREGRIVAEGAPGKVVTADMVQQVFGLPCLVMADPVSHTPMVIPRGKVHMA
ncbi:iron ABC transporter ATP-binding protein [Chitinimonas prasina]|uniref:Iron ABC transporter ATP-binding protein n=1 Tax=Chitinimonas prasina TaxID=1434937 RepID=A0ABQ5YB51_9NEIS|nr:ABC transporter ATP-binding protein [Chitinimonas prasina]GLR12182.1 iron ABC transporter ATP-binding protein [Chitinimonas prasina]